MKLAAYLKQNSLTLEAFGRQIGRTRATVSRLARERHMPDWDTVAAIERATNGSVTANDFTPAEQAFLPSNEGQDAA